MKIFTIFCMCFMLFVGSAFAIDMTVNYDFTDNGGEPVGFTVYWGLEDGNVQGNTFEFHRNVAGTSGSFVTDMEYNTEYFFSVTAYNDDGESGFSETMNVFSPKEPAPVPPNAPSGLSINITLAP